MKATVLGTGSFGTALAFVLAHKEWDVLMYGRNQEVVASINQKNENSRYLPGMALPKNLKATTDLAESLFSSKLVVFAIPTQSLSSVMKDVRDLLPADVPIVSAAKGIEQGTHRIVSEIFEEELPGKFHKSLAYLSGPSFAKEIVQKIPTVVSIASKNEQIALEIQKHFFSSFFRTYWTDDVVGVEVGGALKNVIAIAAGVSDGLNLGHNSRAAIITRGLSEITRLGKAKGANPLTFLGLSGLGDLVLTCTGELSRNRTVGLKLGQGKTIEEIAKEMNQVAEGVATSQSAFELAKRLGLDLAITEAVYRMIYEQLDPSKAAYALMNRELKKETF
mgnify:CR=1 FL=1